MEFGTSGQLNEGIT